MELLLSVADGIWADLPSIIKQTLRARNKG
jgi:hypothetical protein